MKHIYIASHGKMAEGIKDSLALIAGETANQISTYALIPGGNAMDFMKQIEQAILAQPQDQFIVLGDLYGASVVNAMVYLTKYENVVLLAGVNLSLALQILLTGQEKLSDEELAVILQESKNSIQQVRLVADNQSEDDF